MIAKQSRKIVRIDESKCNGCGDCVPNCAEGAIRITNGKARLVAEKLCDGLGACLGHCPMNAIAVEERPAEEFDEAAVHQHLRISSSAPSAPVPPVFTVSPVRQAPTGGCPGSRMQMFHVEQNKPQTEASQPSALRQWPVQLKLLRAEAPMWDNADILLAADCAAFACGDFHGKLLPDKALAIACPKLDERSDYIHKLAAIFSSHNIRSITIARMEVPCCSGLTAMVRQAMELAHRPGIPVKEITITLRGQVQGA